VVLDIAVAVAGGVTVIATVNVVELDESLSFLP